MIVVTVALGAKRQNGCVKSPAANLTDCVSEELRIRCEALRGLLIAEFGFELQEIAAVETAALSDFKKEIEID